MDLHLKYRPKNLSEIFGHSAIVNSLTGFKELPHTFLFHGSSGVGKTTLSRILATLIDKNPVDLVEIDAATNTGIDDVRELKKILPYQGFNSGKKLIIIDECHKLSNSAWNALLLVLEEPPGHVYFALCTTELNKIPKTILTRSHVYELKPLKDIEMEALIDHVCEQEHITKSIIYSNEKAFTALIEASFGSPRQALVYLSACMFLTDVNEIFAILQSDTEEIVEVKTFCQKLIKQQLTYKTAIALVRAIKKSKISPETVRCQIAGYVTACLLNARSKQDMFVFAEILDSFSTPIYNAVTGLQDLILMICNVIPE